MRCVIDRDVQCTCEADAIAAGAPECTCVRFFIFNGKLIDVETRVPCLIKTPGFMCPAEFIVNEEKHGWLLRQNSNYSNDKER